MRQRSASMARARKMAQEEHVFQGAAHMAGDALEPSQVILP